MLALMELDRELCHRVLLARDARYDGRFFTCVKTTGIYCRPICPARPPRIENCIFVPTAAAAAELGFRSCLRCRPESSPDLGAWRGSSATVSRGLALIEAGALDEGDVEALAERLGVGERHLRRLFRTHLGAAPVTVAQTRRVLLAKQLIGETDLSMAQVALAAGFGSVRRFNETFQALYARPPGELRRRKAAPAPADASELVLHLAYRPPYAWDEMLADLARRGDQVGAGVWRRALDGGGEAVVAHAPQRSALRATLRLPRLADLPATVARLRRTFDLATDPVAIAEALGADPLLAPSVEAHPGPRLPGDWDAPAAEEASDAFDTSDPALLARAEAWRPWRAYAALHLRLSAAAGLIHPETSHAAAA